MGNTTSVPSWNFDNNFKYNEPEKSDGCDIVNNRERFVKKCNEWPSGWVASQDLADNYCNKSPNKPEGSTAKVFGTEVWAEWYKNNDCAYVNNQFTYPDAEKENGCRKIGKMKMAKKCQKWPSGWVASGDVVNLCKKNAPSGSTVNQVGTEVWAEWEKDSENCNPGWADSQWKDEGCLSDGNRRFTRKVDTKGDDWDVAADLLLKQIQIGSNLDNLGSVVEKKKEKSALGVWVVVHIDKKDCFNYPDARISKECISMDKRKMSQECKNWPIGWVASGDIINACQKLKPIGSEPIIVGTKVWAEWIEDDIGCNPGWLDSQWKDEGCQTDGTKKWSRKVDAKGLDWNMAVDVIIKTIKNGDIIMDKEVTSVTKKITATGAWIIVYTKDNDCLGSWADAQWKDEGCLGISEKKYSRKIDPKSQQWETAAEYIKNNLIGNNVEGKKVIEKWYNKETTGIWSLVKVDDPGCNPGWLDSQWRDEGCLVDNNRKFTRKVDTKALDWDTAADFLLNQIKIGSNLDNLGSVVEKKKEKSALGIWIVVHIDKKDCIPTTAAPVTTTAAPATTTAAPVTTTAAPVTTTAAPVTTTAAPVTTTAAPVTTTVAPKITTTAAPATTTVAPKITTTAVPVTTTVAPKITTTAVPMTTNAAPVTTNMNNIYIFGGVGVSLLILMIIISIVLLMM